MKTAQPGIDLIKSFEQCRLTAYPDQVGIWTIGWGHVRNVQEGDVITQEQADQYFVDDLAPVEQCINDYVTVDLTQNQFDALSCFTFNVGEGAFRNSTLLRLLNLGNYDGAAQQFGRWNKAGGQVSAGLSRRRQAEHDLFVKEES